MTDIRFYHMVRKRLEQALPEIVARALDRGHRILIKVGSRERVEHLDGILWTADPASFLPHGYAKDGFESQQPVFLTVDDANPNSADMLVLADGAVAHDVDAYKLCCEFFDGNDDAAVQAARARWKSYKDAGHELTYYQQDDDGRWQKKT